MHSSSQIPPIIGIVGTRTGCTDEQLVTAARILLRWNPDQVHHPCRDGGDEQLILLARRLAIPLRIAHPSKYQVHVSREAVSASTRLLRRRHPSRRNQDIADVCAWILACPEGPEQKKSGTWSIIRRAFLAGKRVWIVWPDGRSERRENGWKVAG